MEAFLSTNQGAPLVALRMEGMLWDNYEDGEIGGEIGKFNLVRCLGKIGTPPVSVGEKRVIFLGFFFLDFLAFFLF